MEININFFAVVVAGIASMFVGFVWYGLLFRKIWMELMGFTMESIQQMKMSANTAYTMQFAGSLIMAYVLAHLIVLSRTFYELTGLMAGLTTSLWVWLGFVAPVSLGVVLWEGKPWKLWLINTSNYLASLILMGIILGLWK